MRRLELSESGVLFEMVIGISFDEFLGGAVRLVFGEPQLLCERMQLELYAYSISNIPEYDKRWPTSVEECRAKSLG